MKTLQECTDCNTSLHFKKDFLPLIKQELQILERCSMTCCQAQGRLNWVLCIFLVALEQMRIPGGAQPVREDNSGLEEELECK